MDMLTCQFYLTCPCQVFVSMNVTAHSMIRDVLDLNKLLNRNYPIEGVKVNITGLDVKKMTILGFSSIRFFIPKETDRG